MPRRQLFTIIYAPEVRQHLRAIEPKYYSLIRETIEQQLLHEPTVETHNRKPLRQPAAYDAEWELRFGPNNRFRVFYQVAGEEREVQVLAIGVKKRNKLIIGREEVKL